MGQEKEIDKLLKDLVEPFEMEPSDTVWNSLDQQLERRSNQRNRKVIFRLRLGLIALLGLLGSLTAYLIFSNTSRQPVFIPVSLPAAGNAMAVRSAVKPGSGLSYKSLPVQPAHRGSWRIKQAGAGKTRSAERADAKTESTYTYTAGDASAQSPLRFQQLAETSGPIPEKISDAPANMDLPVKNDILKTVQETEPSEDLSLERPAEPGDSVSSFFHPADSAHLFASLPNSVEMHPASLDTTYKLPFRKRLSVVAYFSPDLGMKYVKDNDKTDHESGGDYNNEEVSDFSFSSGFLLGYDLTKNWTVRTGASYSYLAQTIKPKTAYAALGADGLVHYEFTTSYGSSPLVSDKTPSPAPGDSIRINTQSFQSLQIFSIPVIAKYQVVKNKFSYYVQLGTSINFLAGARLVIEEPGKQQSVHKMEGLSNSYFGGIVGLGIAYSPVKHFSVMLEPTFKGAVTPINKNGPVTTRPLAIGLALGFGWHF